MPAATRMAVVPRFRYADLAAGPTIAHRIPFAADGFDDAAAPGGVRLGEPFVYDAELWAGPVADPRHPPLLLHVHDGLAHTAPGSGDDFFLMEGEPWRLQLDAFSAETLHIEKWAHPGPPAPGPSRTLGAGTPVHDEDGVPHALVDLPCHRFAWWRRLQVLVETMQRMVEPYGRFAVQATTASLAAQQVHDFLMAMGASSPTRHADLQFRRALDGARDTSLRCLAVLDGRLSDGVRTFLRRYSNVCALVWDLLSNDGFHRAMAKHARRLPDDARALVVGAVALLDAVPPGFEAASSAAGVEKTREAPSYADRFLERYLRPWIWEAAVAAGKPLPDVCGWGHEPATGEWRAVVRGAGASALGLAAIALRRAQSPGEKVEATPHVLAGLARAMEPSGEDAPAAGLAVVLRDTTDAIARIVAAGMAEGEPGPEPASGAAGGGEEGAGLTALEAPIDVALDGAREALAHVVEGYEHLLAKGLRWEAPLSEMIRTTRSYSSFAETTRMFYGERLPDFCVRPLASMGPTRGVTLAAMLSGLDAVWSFALVCKAGVELYHEARSPHADPTHALHAAGHGLESLGHFLESASTVGRVLKPDFGLALEVAGKIGAGVAVAGATIGLGLYLHHVFTELPDELEGYVPSDRSYMYAATVVIGLGKACTLAGSVAAFTGCVPATALLAGAGAVFEVTGEILNAVLHRGLTEHAACMKLVARVDDALKALAIEHPELDGKRAARGESLAALHALEGYEGFRPIRPADLTRFHLVEER